MWVFALVLVLSLLLLVLLLQLSLFFILLLLLHTLSRRLVSYLIELQWEKFRRLCLFWFPKATWTV